jgi:O-antigen/teichoic acid export membrane protein
MLETGPLIGEYHPLVYNGAPPAIQVTTESAALFVRTGRSLRFNFAWVLSGNVVYAACQWGMIVALAKIGSSLIVGQFSLGLAIATPVLMFTNLHLRAVQATDAQRQYSFREYVHLRTVMTIAALALIVAIVCLHSYGHETTMIVLAVAAAKAVESLSDIYYGLFQLNDRLDYTGASMMLRGVLSVAALSAGLYFTGKLFWGCVSLGLVWLAALLLFDLRRGQLFQLEEKPIKSISVPRQLPGFRRQVALARTALPLGIVTTLASINLNIPRYFIEAGMGQHQLGIFSALGYTTVAITIVGDALGHCVIPRMSRLYTAGQIAEFRSLQFRLLATGSALGVAGVAISQVTGARLLALFYSAEYAAHFQVFTVLMLAAAVHCIASMFTSGILSARRFAIQVPIFGLTTAATALASYFWIPVFGLLGGAMAMIAGAAVRLILAALVTGHLLYVQTRTPSAHARLSVRIGNWTPAL